MAFVVTKSMRKPHYVDAKVPEADLRRMHSISRRNEPLFSRAFIDLVKGLKIQTETNEFRDAIERAKRFEISIEEAIDTITWYNPLDPASIELWKRLSIKLDNAYTMVITDSAEGEINARKWPMKFSIAKQDTGVATPPNQYSGKYIAMKLDEVKSNLSSQQKELIRQIIFNGVQDGTRVDDILEEIKMAIGLTQRDAEAVDKRLESLLASGVPKTAAVAFASDYASKLLKNRASTISRTEVIQAYNQALQDTWQQAKDEGIAPQNVMKEWAEITLSKKTCKICRGLGRQVVPLSDNFYSDVLGTAVDKPPSHPNCRCTMLLVFPD